VAEVLPLRDLFVGLFFVSVGMLIDPLGLLAQAGSVALLSAVVVLGKLAIVVAVILICGLSGRVALLAGLSLAQIGEFSFVLARLGIDDGAMPPTILPLILGTALVSILITPTQLRLAPRLLDLLERLPLIGPRFAQPLEPAAESADLRHHTIICGFGRVARELAEALDHRGFRYLVIEYNPFIVRELRERGVPVVYGDAANPAVLEHAHLDRARVLAVLIPNEQTAEAVTRPARLHHPRLHIVARATSARDVESLRQAGATEAVQPEFEAGVEVIRHTLRRYGVGGLELVNLVAGRRTAFYSRALEGKQA
jgi:CPA2 family monovalent cation:H+ antiporter-2